MPFAAFQSLNGPICISIAIPFLGHSFHISFSRDYILIYIITPFGSSFHSQLEEINSMRKPPLPSVPTERSWCSLKIVYQAPS